MKHLATLESWKFAARILCLAAFAAIGLIGFSLPAAALILDDSTSTVTVEDSGDVGSSFEVVYPELSELRLKESVRRTVGC